MWLKKQPLVFLNTSDHIEYEEEYSWLIGRTALDGYTQVAYLVTFTETFISNETRFENFCPSLDVQTLLSVSVQFM